MVFDAELNSHPNAVPQQATSHNLSGKPQRPLDADVHYVMADKKVEREMLRGGFWFASIGLEGM